jgi:general secretion pathway protein C
MASFKARAPQWVAGLLVIGLGVQAAFLVADISGGRADAPVTAAPVLAPPRSSVDLAALQAAQLFGAAPAAATPGAAPATTLNLVLVGVLAGEDPARGFAILGPTPAAARLYATGSIVPGGAKLAGVYSDRVTLDRGGGQLETLPMPRQRLASGAPPPPPPTASAVERLGRLATENPGLVGQVIRAQAVLSNGQQRGYRVFPAPNQNAVFARLGLRAGDLVTQINGTPLDDPQRGAEIFSTLSSAAEARVTVMRNGRQEDVVLNLTEVAHQVEQINAAGAAPPSGDTGTNSPAARAE